MEKRTKAEQMIIDIGVYQDVIETSDDAHKEYIAQSHSIPTVFLYILAKDECQGVRLGVAMNTATPTDLFHVLAKDEDPLVRWAVATNPSTPFSIHKILAKDKHKQVKKEMTRRKLIVSYFRSLRKYHKCKHNIRRELFISSGIL